VYDFSIQKDMLEVSLNLLKENNIESISALGGGTALAGYYWNHRYSTDIDMFIYAKNNNTGKLKPNLWSDNIKKQMASIGYKSDFKIHPIYTEFTINEDSKMQFFEVKNYTDNPYTKIKLWDMKFNIESIGEIIAKKIQYRCEKGNTRDLFDIALAIHKQPNILNHININHKKIVALYETILSIKNDTKLSTQYLAEIKQMNPAKQYKNIAINTIEYLLDFLDNYINAYNIGIKLDSEEFKIIEEIIYKKIK
jgi:predicted nucleotidyltransferase component of viral defense system